MTIDPNDFILNSDLAGLGSSGYTTGSFSLPSQTLGGGGINTYAAIFFDIDEGDPLTRILFKITSLEDKWRRMPSIINFDRSNNYYFTDNGVSVTNSNTKFVVGFFLVYRNNQVGVVPYVINRLSPSASANIPQLDIDIRIYTYTMPS